jgi:hypothetical protein
MKPVHAGRSVLDEKPESCLKKEDMTP